MTTPEYLNPIFRGSDISAFKQKVQKCISSGSNIQFWHQLNSLGNSTSHQSAQANINKSQNKVYSIYPHVNRPCVNGLSVGEHTISHVSRASYKHILCECIIPHVNRLSLCKYTIPMNRLSVCEHTILM